MVPNWSDIDSNLLSEIADRINCLRDFIIFGAVCRSWRSVATPDIFNSSTKVPWLLLDEDGLVPRKFFNLSKDVIYNINLRNPPRKVRSSIIDMRHSNPPQKFYLLSFIKEKKYFMSSKGWYLIVENETQLSLLNPFSLSRIDLPHPFPLSKDYGINEVDIQPLIMNFALSSSPNSSSDFTIMIIYRINPTGMAELAFWKNGDRKWTDIDLIFSTFIVDMTYHNGRYYAANPIYRQRDPFPNRYIIHEIDIRNSTSVSIRSKSFTNSSRFSFLPVPFWIVGSSRVLMIVTLSSTLNWERGPSSNDSTFQLIFVVEEVDFENGEGKEMSNFGDEALFLGFNSSYFADVSKESRFKPNHIYFADNLKKSFWRHKGGVGVYSMIDGSSTRLFSESDAGYGCSSQWIEPRP